MRRGLDRREVESLAKTMEIKFTVSGPAIGGAKSGIDFDPSDPRKEGVLRRWFAAVTPLLRAYYGTGGDLNVDEMNEVVPLTESNGLWHPQEGVVNGHFGKDERQRIQRVGQLRLGVAKVVEDARFTPATSTKYTVADLITGYGVAESVRHHQLVYRGTDLAGKRVVVQGWGNVGAAAAYYLAQAGASIVGIIDRDGGILAPEGLSFDEVRTLLLERDGNALRSDRMIPFDEVNAASGISEPRSSCPAPRAASSPASRSTAWSPRDSSRSPPAPTSRSPTTRSSTAPPTSTPTSPSP